MKGLRIVIAFGLLALLSWAIYEAVSNNQETFNSPPESVSLLWNPGLKYKAGMTMVNKDALGRSCAPSPATDLSEANLDSNPSGWCLPVACTDGVQYSSPDNSCPSFFHDTKVGWNYSLKDTVPGWSVNALSGGNGVPIEFYYRNRARGLSDTCTLREVGLVLARWSPLDYWQVWKNKPDRTPYTLGDFNDVTVTFKAKLGQVMGLPQCAQYPSAAIQADFRIGYSYPNGTYVRQDVLGLVIYNMTSADFNGNTNDNIYWYNNCQPQCYYSNYCFNACQLALYGSSFGIPQVTSNYQTYSINYLPIILQNQDKLSPPPGFSIYDATIIGFDLYSSVRGGDLDLQISDVDVRTVLKAGVAYCGNSVIETGEECDGNTGTCNINGYLGSKSCSQSCKWNSCTTTQRCGDGICNGAENSSSCPNDCAQTPVCGNGIKDGTEECDDGNSNNNDACTNLCKTAKCGDSVLWAGVEQCELGNSLSCTTSQGYSGFKLCSAPTSCTYGNCQTNERCGDNILQVSAGEECDYGNNNGISCSPMYITGCSYCTSTCKLNSVPGAKCGDGVCNSPFENSTLCSLDCPATSFCGNGVIESGEQCDLSNLNGKSCSTIGYSSGTLSCIASGNTNQCLYNASLCSLCGNGIIESGETCDGNQDTCSINGYSGIKNCSNTCSFNSCIPQQSCGDGICNGAENNVSCSQDCLVAPTAPILPPSTSNSCTCSSGACCDGCNLKDKGATCGEQDCSELNTACRTYLSSEGRCDGSSASCPSAKCSSYKSTPKDTKCDKRSYCDGRGECIRSSWWQFWKWF